MTSRRDFLRSTAGALVLGTGLTRAALAAVDDHGPRLSPRAPKPLDLLVLGGTGFIGPHLVRHAVEHGHRVSIFTRGRRDAELPSSVTRLVGDRNGQLGALAGKRWDVVIDDSATNPDWVAQSTELLKDSGAYMFTSSTGVYYPYLTRGLDESVAVHTDLKDPKDGSETFGVAKARCEAQTMKVFGDRGIVIRPTYIVGPGDTSDRFPYWPVRLARGGEVLAPGHADDPMQIIDVRDLAEFMVYIAETGQRGIFNVAGPNQPLAARAFYEQAARALGADVKYTFVDDYDFLVAHKIEEAIPWALLRGNDYGMMSIKNDRAIAAGLMFRPLATTLRDTAAWWPTVPESRREKPRFTITPEIETQALADWRKRG